MKHFKLIFPIFFVLVMVTSVFTQSKFYGIVTEVLDGRTLIIEPQPKVKIKIELQYIEVPEVEQKLHGVVKDHLTNMVLNKQVEFIPKNINETASPVGQVLVNGVDVSQQMLRDGAAWYSISDKHIQNESESTDYQNTETLAKNEKRGVWSIADLKPAWEFRAEKVEKIRLAELKEKEEENARLEKIRTEAREKAKNQAEARRKTRALANQSFGANSSMGLGLKEWEDNSIEGMPKKEGHQNLFTKFIPAYQIEYTLTGGNSTQFKFEKKEIKIGSRSLYVKKDGTNLELRDIFGIGFLSQSEKGTFETSNELTIYADKVALNLGKAFRLYEEDGKIVKELLLYKISEQQLEAISNAKDVKLKLGTYTSTIDQKYKGMIKDLIESSK